MPAGDPERLRQAGLDAIRRGDPVAAARAFEQAAALQPTDPRHHAQLANARMELGDLNGARASVHEAVALNPPLAPTLDLLGHVSGRTGDYDLAAALSRRAAAAAPNNPAILRNLGWMELYVGALDASETAFRAALALAPDDDKAWFALASTARRPFPAHEVAALERLFSTVEGDAERGLGIGHALARAYELRGDPALALRTLTRAKAAFRRLRSYDVAHDVAALEAAALSAERGPVGQGAAGAPIFVVGIPRSGTTLMDRILSSHPDVASAGELRALPMLVQAGAGLDPNQALEVETFRRVAGAPAQALGEAYMKTARAMSGGAERFVDKQPFNFALAGVIARALPDARIIHLRRDPMDTVLGNYRQFFATRSPNHGYAYDLEDAARYVVGVERLAADWRAQLPPDRYMTLSYEALVADPETEVRRVLGFCGLTWDPRCLAFHENPAGVSTASAAQVREPLHGRNIGRWKAYGDQLAPAAAILAAAGLLEP
jgi:tetratricopeptide (TPR) repeat protein